MQIGVSFAATLPAESVVKVSRPVARSLCGFRRWANPIPAKMEAKASTTARLAGKDLLGYKFIVIFKHGNLMQVNDKAPEFALANEDGEKVSLKGYRGKNLVLFFFPKANTPG